MMLPPKRTEAEDVVNIAREWLGTKYVHQASLKGVGCDCLGLLRGVWKDIYEEDSETPPPYTSIWAENTRGREPMLDAAKRHLIQVPPGEGGNPGEVFLIRIRNRSAVKHCGIISYDNKLIHAYDNHDVMEAEVHPSWLSKDHFYFRFPGVIY